MKKWLKVLSLILCIVVIIVFNPFYDTIENYQYPVTTDDPEWAEFDSIHEMLAACRIPDDTLTRMSTEALLQAVVDFPLLGNVFAYNSHIQGLNALKRQCDAYTELLNRSDAANKLVHFLTRTTYESDLDTIEELVLQIILLEEPVIQDSLVKDNSNILNIGVIVTRNLLTN